MPRKHDSTTTGNDNRARITVDLDTKTREMLDDMLAAAKERGKGPSISHVVRLCIQFCHATGVDRLLEYWFCGYR